jgi:hypothetical protein
VNVDTGKHPVRRHDRRVAVLDESGLRRLSLANPHDVAGAFCERGHVIDRVSGKARVGCRR